VAARDRVPTAWKATRQTLLFVLGVALVLHATFGNGSIDRVVELIVGLILMGIVPIDVLVDRVLGHSKPSPPEEP